MTDRGEGPDERFVVGLDIGGANLKLAWRRGDRASAVSKYFPMWQEHCNLSQAIRDLLFELQEPPSQIAVTMTGELADCFASREVGVSAILRAVQEARQEIPTVVYSVDDEWFSLDEAIACLPAKTWAFAASNWKALATWIAQLPQFAGRSGIMVDIGSTTVDVIPFESGRVATSAKTDHDRLLAKQLVYTGLERTPICAIVSSVKVGNADCPVMAERFAESQDAYLLLGELASDEDCCDTADGRPRLPKFAAARLARMVGEDSARMKNEDLLQIAEEIVQTQVDQVLRAMKQNLPDVAASQHSLVCFCGHAAGMFRRLTEGLPFVADTVQLAAIVGEDVARSAPAFALVELAQSETSHPEVIGLMSSSEVRVVKVGGSLLDIPNLGDRLASWLSQQPRAVSLFVVGGGGLVDAVRDLDSK
ncbi:MAG: hydantoinase/oxoprolinase family protein, partial [Planctomycetota bacterium]